MHLALDDVLDHRLDGRGLAVTLLLGPLGGERAVRDEQRRDQLRGEAALAVGQLAGHLGREPLARLRDLGVAELRPLGDVEDARRLGPERRPPLGLQGLEDGSGVRRTGPGSTASSSAWRCSAEVSGANAVSSGETCFVNAESCAAAIVIARSDV